MFYQNSIGIALRENQVELVYLKNTLQGITLVEHVLYPLKIDPSDKHGGTLKQADAAGVHIKSFIQEHRITNAEIYLSIPRSLALIRFIKLPLAVKENLADTLKYEMEKYIPLPLVKIYYDFQIVEENSELNQITVMLTVVRKKNIAPIIRMANKMELGLSGVEIDCSAITNYFAYNRNIEGGAETQLVMLQLTKNQLEIAYILKNHLVQSRQIDTDSGTDEILAFVDKCSNARVGKETLNVLYGGISTDEKLENELKARPLLTIGRLSRIRTDGLTSEVFIPAFGLALKGLKKVPMQLNLLPEGLRKQTSKVGYYTAFGLLGLVLLLSVIWTVSTLIYFQRTRVSQNTEIQKLSKGVAVVQSLMDKIKRMDQEITFFQGVTQRRIVSLVLKELTERIPKSAWIRNMSFSNGQIRIEGEADSASNLIPILEASPLFKEVGTLSTTIKTREGKDKFTIGLKLE